MPVPVRPAQPLLSGAGVSVAAERGHVDRDRARRPARRRAARAHPARASSAGARLPLIQPTCQHATRRVRGPTACRRCSRERHLADAHAGAARAPPRARRAGPGAPRRWSGSRRRARSSRPPITCAMPLGRAGRQRHVGRLAAQRRGVGRAQLARRARRGARSAPARGPSAQLALELLLAAAAPRAPAAGPSVPGVQVRRRCARTGNSPRSSEGIHGAARISAALAPRAGARTI